MKKDELINTIIELYKLWNDDTEDNYAKIDYILHKTCKKLGKLKEVSKNYRTCNECGKEMTEGYCIENGTEYYCSDECLHKNITEEEYLKLYDNGNGDSYWTEWECD